MSAACSLRGTVMVPQGLDFRIGDALGDGILAPSASVILVYVPSSINGPIDRFTVAQNSYMSSDLWHKVMYIFW
jgi:hypothetical protein